MVGIELGGGPCGGFDVIEECDAVEHFRHCVGAEEVEVYEVEFAGCAAFVAFRPFHGIAYGADTFQVHARHEV